MKSTNFLLTYLLASLLFLGMAVAAPVQPKAKVALSSTQKAQTPKHKPNRVSAEQLSTFSTQAGGSAKRLKNIGLAVDRINGTRLAPGRTFSFNRTVGPRTGDRGFRTATVFEDRKKVPGVGGGVSQVTGTLFNAAALAGLQIDEVHPHSRPVAYLPAGRDATVEYGAVDLKFTNNTKSPITIRYILQGRRLSASILGKKVPGQKISLKTKVKTLAPGKVSAMLFRTYTLRGKQQRQERLYSHIYSWNPKG
ncbi:MAG: VanW family protein [Anaerolineae bacterium]|nr:VanW family protein [Gloeobacterales cyanobacterium ES-bin-313]